MTFYFPDPDFGPELLRSTDVKDLLTDLAEQGAELYRDSVPVDEGDLQASIFGDVELTDQGYQGRIGATDWKAALVEFGGSLHSPDGSLRQSIDALGLELEEEGPS